MEQQLYFENYNPSGDIVVFAICCVIAVLLATSYVAKNRYFLLFVSMITHLLLASITNITQHDLFLHITDGDYTPIYVMHILYHIFLFSLFLVIASRFSTVNIGVLISEFLCDIFNENRCVHSPLFRYGLGL